MIGFITTPFWTRGTLLVRTSPSTWLFNFWMWSGRLFLCTSGFTLLLLGGDFIWGLGSETGFGGAAGTGLGLMLASFSLFCPTTLTTQTYNYKTEECKDKNKNSYLKWSPWQTLCTEEARDLLMAPPHRWWWKLSLLWDLLHEHLLAI